MSKKISGLAAGSSLVGTEEFEALQSGGNFGITANQIKTFATPTPAALTKADDTNVTLTLGGSPSSALLAAASISAGWTGTLAVGRGGTGDSGTAWSSYTPSIGAGGGSGVTTTNLFGRWKTIGKTTFFNISFTITATGGATGAMSISLPFSTATANDTSVAFGVDCTSGLALAAFCSGTNNSLSVTKYDGSSPYTIHAFAFSGCFESA